MIDKYKIGWVVLNIQLLIAVVTAYSLFSRHVIIDNTIVYFIFVVCFSNLLFLLLQKIKYFSIRSFISILVSALLMILLFLKYNKPEMPWLEPMHYVLAIIYIVIVFSLYITTPLAIILEIFLRWKMKRK